MKRYPVEMGWVVEPTDEDGIAAIVSEIDGEEVVLASDYDALLADAKRLMRASRQLLNDSRQQPRDYAREAIARYLADYPEAER
jgi:hypothetical protein